MLDCRSLSAQRLSSGGCCAGDDFGRRLVEGLRFSRSTGSLGNTGVIVVVVANTGQHLSRAKQAAVANFIPTSHARDVPANFAPTTTGDTTTIHCTFILACCLRNLVLSECGCALQTELTRKAILTGQLHSPGTSGNSSLDKLQETNAIET